VVRLITASGNKCRSCFEHFGHYGYEKTTVAELAKSIGFSKSYIYKFFDSKQAIGEVICANRGN
jgi:AcrR family transcriptional regulator